MATETRQRRRTVAYGDHPFEQLLGDDTRILTIRYLIERDGAHKQQDIANAIGVSQPMISRVLSDFEEMDIIERTRAGVELRSTKTTHQLSILIDTLGSERINSHTQHTGDCDV